MAGPVDSSLTWFCTLGLAHNIRLFEMENPLRKDWAGRAETAG